jgi:hypothetical protein
MLPGSRTKSLYWTGAWARADLLDTAYAKKGQGPRVHHPCGLAGSALVAAVREIHDRQTRSCETKTVRRDH